MLVRSANVSDEAANFRERAAHCRRLAQTINDKGTIAKLEELAREYEARAAEIEHGPKPPSTAQ